MLDPSSHWIVEREAQTDIDHHHCPGDVKGLLKTF